MSRSFKKVTKAELINYLMASARVLTELQDNSHDALILAHNLWKLLEGFEKQYDYKDINALYKNFIL